MSQSLLLASSSPRRKEILTNLGFSFSVATPSYDEKQFSWTGDWEIDVQQIAKNKVLSLSEKNALILGADTIVVTNTLEGEEKRLGKPRDWDQALHYIALLQGRVHEVYSGVALRRQDRVETAFCRTQVKICSMTLEQQVAYLKRVDPLDKAGGYAIQNQGAIAIEWIEGCESNVRGLPIQPLHKLFQTYGVDLFLPPQHLRAL